MRNAYKLHAYAYRTESLQTVLKSEIVSIIISYVIGHVQFTNTQRARVRWPDGSISSERSGHDMPQ